MNLKRLILLSLFACSVSIPALSQAAPGRRAPNRQAPEAIGFGLEGSGSVATLAPPSSYGWAGSKSFGAFVYSVDSQRRKGLRLEGFGGYSVGLQVGIFSQKIIKRRDADIYAGVGGGVGIMTLYPYQDALSGGYLYIEPAVGVKTSRRRAVLTGELYYALTLSPSFPMSEYLGRGGFRLGIAFEKKTRPRNRGPNMQNQPQGPRGPNRPPPPPSRGSTPPPPSKGTKKPPPPSSN